MRAQVAGRVALAVVALAVVGWLAFGLRALVLQDRGLHEASAAGIRPAGPHFTRTGPHFTRALDLLRRAGEHNPDPRPQIDEAVLLLYAGDNRGSARLLEAVVKRNSGNVRAWGLLATAAASFDERRSLQANGELLRLYGHIPGRLGNGVVRSPGGVRYRVAPGHVIGVVDGVVRLGHDRLAFVGWARIVATAQSVNEVLIVSHGRVVAAGVPTVHRRDVKLANGSGRSGFRIVVPIAALRNDHGELDAHVLGAGGGAASLLSFNCARRPFVGC